MIPCYNDTYEKRSGDLMNRRADRLDAEIAERARSKRHFDLCEERPQYEPVQETPCNVSKHSLELAARKTGPSFVYNLYVAPIRLLAARNLVWSIWANVQKNPFAPHINIVECPAFDEGEWCLEANDKLVGSNLPW